MSAISSKLRELADHIDFSDKFKGPEGSELVPTLQGCGKDIDFGAIADRLYKSRRQRDRLFGVPGLFSDPAWDILLDMLWNENRLNRVSVTSACIASCVPQTTALRWISTLEQHGLIERCQDAADARRTYVRLTKLGRKKTCSAIANFIQKEGSNNI